MGTIANTPLVSNKVFQAIQPYQVIKETTGTVIYANKYADVAEVPMPDWVKSILDSDAGTVGLNPLVQLQGKLQYLADGPWYTDSRNGMLYIHNKKFREDSIHTYVYQSENGEVIRISFDTQRVKHVDVAKALGVDPKKKEAEQERSATEELQEKLNFLRIELKSSTYVAPIPTEEAGTIRKHPRNLEDIQYQIDHKIATDRGRPTAENWGQINNAQETWMKFMEKSSSNSLNGGKVFEPGSKEHAEMQANYIYEHQNQTRTDNLMAEAVRKKIRSQMNPGGNLPLQGEAKQLQENYVTTKTAEKIESLTAEMGRVLYQAKKKKQDPRSALKALYDEYFGVGARHAYTAKVWKQEYVDPATYRGNNTFDPKYNMGSLSKMQKDPNIMIIGELEKVPTKTYHKYRILIFHPTWHQYSVSLSKELTDWALRNAGYDPKTGGWKKDKLANASGTWEEKKLVVKMDVVGRPSLSTSQTLTILNVGQRWSGTYYVKTCSHRMDASEGYICSLELSKNKGKPGVHTREDKINNEKVVKDNATGNDRSKNRGASKVTDKAVHKTERSYTSPKTVSSNKRNHRGKSSNKRNRRSNQRPKNK